MSIEQERALRCEQLAARFDRGAEQDDLRATEWRRWADQKRLEAEEHPEASGLRTLAEELLGVAAHWESSAAWGRAMASKFRRRSDEHRARHGAGLQ
jgi:hypothetical protein